MKISIIGIGHVGVTIAYTLVVRGLCDELVLFNRSSRIAEGEAADLQHAAAFATKRMTIRAGALDATADSDLVIFTASSRPTSPVSGRNALISDNANILRELLPTISRLSPRMILLMVTNPVDAMTFLATRWTPIEPTRILGTGTLIDSARFRSNLSQHLEIHADDIRAYVLGEHGSTQFPALSIAATGGQKIDRDATIQELFRRAVDSAHEIFAIKGFTNYAIGLATCMIVEAIVLDSHRTLPVSCLMQGFEGQRDVCLSVPAIVGREGIVRQLQPQLNDEESHLFRASADAVRSVIQSVAL